MGAFALPVMCPRLSLLTRQLSNFLLDSCREMFYAEMYRPNTRHFARRVRSLPSGSWLLRPGHGSQRGCWCCGPFALRRRRSSKSYSGTRQQLLQLWQDTLQLVQGGSGTRQQAAQASDADAMADVSTLSA